MKASELVEVLKAAIEKHGDHVVDILRVDGDPAELILKYKAPFGQPSWYVTLMEEVIDWPELGNPFRKDEL